MSVVVERDYAVSHDLRGATITRIREVGLERSGIFYSLFVEVLLGEDGFVCIDRGLHPSTVTLHDLEKKTREEVVGISHLVLERGAGNPRFPFPKNPEIPFSTGTHLVEKVLEELTGQSIERVLVAGNRTLAVGLLPMRAILLTSSGLALDSQAADMEGATLVEHFGVEAAGGVGRLFLIRADSARL